jgi:outer membrane immunogenic protein
MRKILTPALFALAAASPAVAQDTAPFTGLRVEGLIGWDRLQNGGKDDDLVWGGGVGYDMQMGGALVGAEAELTDSNIRDCAGAGTALDPRDCIKTARDIYVGGRVGMVSAGSMLLYAKAGYTNLRSKFTSDDGTTETTLAKSDLDGIRVGAGAEYGFGPNAFAKAEYRYSNYEQGIERHQVVAGIGFRF